MMVCVIAQFQLDPAWTREQAQQVFAAGAGKFLGLPGLVRKYFLIGEDGTTAAGVYLWRERPQAEAYHDAAWQNEMQQFYGARPGVSYFEIPVIVDNLTSEIILSTR
jgi:hypothetical protein